MGRESGKRGRRQRAAAGDSSALVTQLPSPVGHSRTESNRSGSSVAPRHVLSGNASAHSSVPRQVPAASSELPMHSFERHVRASSRFP